MNAEANAELGTLDATVWNATIGAIRQRAGFSAEGVAFPVASKEQLINNLNKLYGQMEKIISSDPESV